MVIKSFSILALTFYTFVSAIVMLTHFKTLILQFCLIENQYVIQQTIPIDSYSYCIQNSIYE